MVSGGGDGGVGDAFATPGFRFYPTEEELLGFYLRHRLAGTRPDVERVIPVVDVYSYHPCQLAAMAGEASARNTEQWFFFCPRAERELHGGRPARTTPSGYWKATGSPSCVFSAATNRVIGVKRTMVFYLGRAPTGTKTRWKMNEYKAVADNDDTSATATAVLPPAAAPPNASYACLQLRNELSVCRVYISTGTLLRSFDRRPLDYPSSSSGHDRQEAVQQQQRRDDLAGVVVAGAQAAECSSAHEDSGYSSEDAAIDWNSLITINTAGDFSFNDIVSVVGTTWPQL